MKSHMHDEPRPHDDYQLVLDIEEIDDMTVELEQETLLITGTFVPANAPLDLSLEEALRPFEFRLAPFEAKRLKYLLTKLGEWSEEHEND